jgi:hypothetical protein
VIKYGTSFEAKKLYGQEVEFDGHLIKLSDPNQKPKYKFYTFRLLWLPAGFLESARVWELKVWC